MAYTCSSFSIFKNITEITEKKLVYTETIIMSTVFQHLYFKFSLYQLAIIFCKSNQTIVRTKICKVFVAFIVL